MSVRLKLALYLLVLFSVSIASSMLTFKLEAYSDEKLEWVIHTNNVITSSEKLLSSLKDAETGQRGFLLTHNLSYLKPYYVGKSEAKNVLDRLYQLTSDNKEQQKALDHLSGVMQLKFDELRSTIELAQNNQQTEALAIVKEDKGKVYMDDLRKDLTQFINIELLLLEKRKGDYKENRSQLVTFIKLQMVFLVFLAIATIFFMKRNLFDPLHLLLSSTKKMQQGEKLDISDIVEKNEMGNLLSAFFTMNEIVHEKTETLTYKAHHDELTGLKNRSMVNDDLEYALQHAKRSHSKVAVYFIDLNKFKEINDTLGHDVGDEVLVKTSQLLTKTVRKRDNIYRLGGDEFLIIGQEITQNSGIKRLSSKLLAQFSVPMMIGTEPMDVSLSIGVAIYPDHAQQGEELIKYADIAMYEAKKDEGTTCCDFTPSMLKRESD
ncbi:diguanylate cyclase domain-containing protein [Aliivibrio sp. EL58]|uniref:diguanylate cyclase domain-containing protein n=1 Tax=Aliivibrio sp. EL58 TaxID=2107582 RepID=UPI000EFD7F53|nr:diguanylate cyclase [Aliivibrio sp. EL58]